MTQHTTAGAHTPDPASLTGRLLTTVDGLRQSAADLRVALMHRRLDDIWQILAQQEQQALMLEQFGRLWQELRPGGAMPQDSGDADARRRIAVALQETRHLQRTNFALAQCFLAVVRRALQDAGAQSVPALAVYNRAGKRGWTTASRLVSCVG